MGETQNNFSEWKKSNKIKHRLYDSIYKKHLGYQN